MIPFHLFLFSMFFKSKETEITMEQYQYDLLVKNLHQKSKDVLFQMNTYM
jgi:hypothetical protein